MQRLRVGVVFWTPSDGLATQTSTILHSLGHEAIAFQYDGRLPADLDIVFLSGPFDSLVPLAKQLLATPATQRPALIWWLTEQLPNPKLPQPLLHWGGLLRSQAERLAYRQTKDGLWRATPALRRMLGRAQRLRYYGDLCWLRQTGMLTAVVTGSPWRAAYLRARGIEPTLVPNPSYRPDWGAELNLERDIPVLWLGKHGTRRRHKVLQQVRRELRERGVEMLLIDGVENGYVFGDERTHLLNRTQIVLNLQRTEWDNHAGRFALAAQNRCLLVTEPTLAHTAFQPGVHIVEAPVDRLADTICHYLTNDEQRRQIAANAHALIYQISREEVVGRLLEAVVVKKRSERSCNS